MLALFLEDAGRFTLRELPEPIPAAHEVLLRVGAVGVCGTDFHIYEGHANYNVDRFGRSIPLTVQPQILGHEFCGTVESVGEAVRDVQPGERVVVDQGMNCFSRKLHPPCEYCSTGHSHQCLYYRERGITGLPGAMQEFVCVPATNVVPLEPHITFAEAALAEPLGCVLHSLEMTRRTTGRFSLDGELGGHTPVETVLITGAGPSGLLFLLCLRRLVGFEGRILVADRIEGKLELVEEFDGTPLSVTRCSLAEAVRSVAGSPKIDLLIEASGSGAVFEQMPAVLKKQATVLLYGHGHEGTDLSVLNRLLFLEPTLVAAAGASGPLDPITHRPRIHGQAVELLRTRRIEVEPLISHRYHDFVEVQAAFRKDHHGSGYVKGVLSIE